MFSPRWEKAPPLRSGCRNKKTKRWRSLASVPIWNHRGGTGWLVAGMLLICGGCSLEMSSPRPELWRINHLPPKTGSARFFFIDTASSSPVPSSNKAKGEKGLELTEPSPVSGKEQQPLASPRPISPTPEIPEKEKDSALPVIKVPEKEKQPSVPVPKVSEKGKPAAPVPEVAEKEKQPSVPVPKVSEKGKPAAPVPEVAEKEKQPSVPVPKVSEKGEPAAPVPEVPEKEKKPPILVPEVPEKVNGQAVVTYKTKIEETRDLIRVIDESRLTKEQHDTFNSIHSFLEKAQEAFSQDDMSMAVNLAEKANTLAKEIVRNSP
jgi:hypothetical protein